MIYLKDINGVPTEAPSEYQDETGFYPAFNQNAEAMQQKGWLPYDENDHAQYIAGIKLFVNGEFVDNVTEDYLASIKEDRIAVILEERSGALNEFDIAWSRNVVLGLKTAEDMATKRNILKAEYDQRKEEIENE